MDKSITIHGPGPDHLTVDGNHASGVFRVQVGGGGTATIAGLTITNGNANRGGGINNESSMLTVSNYTISGNSAPDVFGAGGGIFNDVAFSNATLEILNCTISGNSAGDNGGGIYNGGNYSDPILKIGDTILNAGPSGENIHNESGTTISLGYNLSSDNGGDCLTATGDRINTDPKLGPLQNNGGSTFTHLPASQ